MPNQSLIEKFIFSGNTSNHFFGLENLQDIAIGIARRLEYLHKDFDQRIHHFYIKPHNILPDTSFNPNISNFGFEKLCSMGLSAVSMAVASGGM